MMSRPIHAHGLSFGRATLALLACCFGLATQAAPNTPQLDLPRVQLRAGLHLIDAQVARTPEQQSTGLMHRRGMPDKEGMLFVFNQAGLYCFWMKNTLIPLTAAFLADDGRIVNLADMTPGDETPHCAKEPVRMVLEMNQGWFALRRIEAGQKMAGAAFQNPRP